jgi:hypothetical protein
LAITGRIGYASVIAVNNPGSEDLPSSCVHRYAAKGNWNSVIMEQWYDGVKSKNVTITKGFVTPYLEQETYSL